MLRPNMNMKSTYLHLLTDMMASVAVLIGGLLMKYNEVYWVDSALTFVIAIYLIWMGWDLFKKFYQGIDAIYARSHSC